MQQLSQEKVEQSCVQEVISLLFCYFSSIPNHTGFVLCCHCLFFGSWGVAHFKNSFVLEINLFLRKSIISWIFVLSWGTKGWTFHFQENEMVCGGLLWLCFLFGFCFFFLKNTICFPSLKVFTRDFLNRLVPFVSSWWELEN